MKPVVIKRPRAKRDLSEIYTYIADRSPRATERFLEAAEAAFADLAAMPGMGRQWGYAGPGLEGVRVWRIIPRFRNYLIFYRPIPNGIEVLHVFHRARDIPALLGAEETD